MASAPAFRLGGLTKGGVRGLPEMLAKLEAIPQALKAQLQPAIEQEADELVDNIKAITPVSDLESHPGELRDSVHKEAANRDLAVRVTVDAQNKGQYYAPHVEYGHKTRNGGHVPAQPFFWPSVRVSRERIRRRLRVALRRAIKAEPT